MHHRFYHPFVFWDEIENHEEIKEELLPKIYEDVKENGENYLKSLKWDCEVVTSFSNMQNSDIFLRKDSIIQSIVWNPFNKMFEEISPQVDADQANLTEIWYNFYRIGDEQEIHDHQKAQSFSGIYLLHINEPNTTVFYNPSIITNEYFHTENIKEGSVILFPSHLPHYVKASKKGRVTISFNIEFE